MLEKLNDKWNLIKRSEADEHLELFFVSAVSAILVIRFLLALTGYPQLSPGDLHIAHMLWGGIFMLVAQMLLLTYSNRAIGLICAVIGGIGFGTFIDELGKFITKDNDYFFRPTVAILYVFFVLLFFLFRALGKNSPTEHPFTLHFLNNFFRSSKVQALAIIALIGYSAVGVVTSGIGIASIHQLFMVGGHISQLAAASIDAGSSLVSALLVFVGASQFRRYRITALRLFKLSLLISLAISQVFSFYRVQFWALSDLFINLIILGVVQQLLSDQQLKNKS